MSESKTCGRCGATLSEDTTGGLCPRCLMAMNFDSRTMPEGEAPPQVAPLSPEEMREHFPQFEILECLGRGGMGVVYKARQKALDREVAIKVLAGEWQGDPGFAARFEKEAKTLAQMSHPNIVTVHDFGEAGGLFYIVMEFIDGVNLRDLMREGKMAPEQALAIVPPVCEALEYAHGKGVVHRDIKPENVLLDRDGRVKIADFGIASLVGATGEKSGTPPYMAPEQESGSVDRRADIYALGVVLYEMLTGERPTADAVAPSRKVEVDVRIDELVLRALEKEPERRYQTAVEFRTLVETIRPAEAPAGVGTPATKPKGMFRRFWWMFLVMLVLGPALGLVAGLGLGYLAPKQYEARSVIQIIASPEMMAEPSFLPAALESLHSRELLEEVSQDLGLPQRWMLDPAMATDRLKTIVSIVQLRGTDLIQIKVRDTDAGGTAEIANAVAEGFTRRAMVDGLKVIVHERATPPRSSVSPNSLRLVLLCVVAGLLLSPVLALASIPLFHRLFPETPVDRTSAPSSPTGKWAIGLLVLAIAAAFNGIGRELLTPLALILAFVVGLMARRTTAGKVAAIISGSVMLLIGLRIAHHLLKQDHPSPPAVEIHPIESSSNKVAIEDLALRMIVAIRDKDDATLRSLAIDRTPGWRDALPTFALELRERYRQLTGKDDFDLRPTDSLVKGDYGVVRCTGPAMLEGRCVIFSFVKSPEGWKNCKLQISTDDMPLDDHLAGIKVTAPEEVGIRSLSNKALLQRLSDDPGKSSWFAWLVLGERAREGRVTAAEADKLVERVIRWMKQERPDGVWDTPTSQWGALQDLQEKQLISKARILDYLQAHYAKPQADEPPRIRAGTETVPFTLNMQNVFTDEMLGYRLLNEVRSVAIDGKVVRISIREGRSPHSAHTEHFRFALPTADLAPGTHRVWIEVSSALVSAEEYRPLLKEAPPALEDWPPAIRQWTRTCEAELHVVEPEADSGTSAEVPSRKSNATPMEVAEAEVVVKHANTYLDLLTTVAANNAGSLGEAHPHSRVDQARLDEFAIQHPEFPDAVCARLAKARLKALKADLAGLTAGGLGPTHPNVRVQTAIIEAMERIAKEAE